MDDPRYDHLAHLTTPTGLYEHALFTEPRVEHGFCVDDVARALVVTSRADDPTPGVVALSRIYLQFLLAAQTQDGLMHNRRDSDGRWLDVASTADGHEITTTLEDLVEVTKALEARFGEPTKSKLVWKPQNTIAVDDEAGEKILRLIGSLEDNDDVQNVYANFEISDALVAKLGG